MKKFKDINSLGFSTSGIILAFVGIAVVLFLGFQFLFNRDVKSSYSRIDQLDQLYKDVLASTKKGTITQKTEATISVDFVQPWLLTYEPMSSILKQFKVLKRAGINSVVLQYTAEIDNLETEPYFNNLWYNSSLKYVTEDTVYESDVIEKVMEAAKRAGIDVYIGIGLTSEWWNEANFDNDEWLNNFVNINNEISEEIYEMYKDHSNFEGFYFPYEMYTNGKNLEEKWVDVLNSNLDFIHDLDSNISTISDVFISSLYLDVDMQVIKDHWNMFLENAHFTSNDILTLQDGLGTIVSSPNEIIKYIEIFSDLTAKSDVKFSIIVENYNTDGTPSEFERYRYQLLINSYYADSLMAFSYLHYYSPLTKVNNQLISKNYDEEYRINMLHQDILNDTEITALDAPLGGTVYVDSEGREAPIPSGFTVSNDASENLIRAGLVVHDTNMNEYVWIPVNYGIISSDFVYKDATNVGYARNILSGFKLDNIKQDTLPEGVESDLKQIDKYFGFYVGRYESSYNYENGRAKVAIKKSIDNKVSTTFSWKEALDDIGYTWNNVSYGESKKFAESMASDYGYSKVVKTGMINGSQWDTILRFIHTGDPTFTIVSDSRSWGNYKDAIAPANTGNYESGVLQSTGSNENWKRQNIYDLAGNLMEWTSEIVISNGEYIIRSGGYTDTGLYGSSAYGFSSASYSFNTVGFRVVLYID